MIIFKHDIPPAILSYFKEARCIITPAIGVKNNNPLQCCFSKLWAVLFTLNKTRFSFGPTPKSMFKHKLHIAFFQKKWGKCYDYYDNITVICTNSNVGVATFDAIKHMEHTTVDSFHVCGRWNWTHQCVFSGCYNVYLSDIVALTSLNLKYLVITS